MTRPINKHAIAAALAAAALVASPAAWLARADTAAKPATQREGARADGAKAGAQTQTSPDADPDGLTIIEPTESR